VTLACMAAVHLAELHHEQALRPAGCREQFARHVYQVADRQATDQSTSMAIAGSGTEGRRPAVEFECPS